MRAQARRGSFRVAYSPPYIKNCLKSACFEGTLHGAGLGWARRRRCDAHSSRSGGKQCLAWWHAQVAFQGYLQRWQADESRAVAHAGYDLSRGGGLGETVDGVVHNAAGAILGGTRARMPEKRRVRSRRRAMHAHGSMRAE